MCAGIAVRDLGSATAIPYEKNYSRPMSDASSGICIIGHKSSESIKTYFLLFLRISRLFIISLKCSEMARSL